MLAFLRVVAVSDVEAAAAVRRTVAGLVPAGLAATFLAAPWVLSQKAHVTVDLITSALPNSTGCRVPSIVSATALGYRIEQGEF